MTPSGRFSRMTNRRGENGLQTYRFVVEKSPEGDGSRPVAAEPAKASRALQQERAQKIGPLFCSRLSPNDPKSTIPSMTAPSANQMTRQSESQNRSERKPKVVCML